MISFQYFLRSKTENNDPVHVTIGRLLLDINSVMEIIIKLQLDDNKIDNQFILDETALIVENTFNIGAEYSACISATVSLNGETIKL